MSDVIDLTAPDYYGYGDEPPARRTSVGPGNAGSEECECGYFLSWPDGTTDEDRATMRRLWSEHEAECPTGTRAEDTSAEETPSASTHLDVDRRVLHEVAASGAPDTGLSGDITAAWMVLVKLRQHFASPAFRAVPGTMLVLGPASESIDEPGRVAFVLEHLQQILAEQDSDFPHSHCAGSPRSELLTVPTSPHAFELVSSSTVVGYATWHRDLNLVATDASHPLCGGQLRYVVSGHLEDRTIVYAVGCSTCPWVATRRGLRVVTI